tara:strand:+ start:928 stop:1152 length:225 start_codon:yes stop_codon:yes gene_type:complete
MIGVYEMRWTAILEKDGVTTATSFNSGPDREEAWKNIRTVVQCDGFRVLGLFKGDHQSGFYGVELDKQQLTEKN